MLVIAPFYDGPYGYYVLLRLVVTVAAAYLAFREYQSQQAVGPWVIGFGFLALLFNPLIPVELNRGIWLPIDLASAAAFVVYFFKGRKRS